MLSSYFQIDIPSGSLFVGEIDLTQAVRPLAPAICEHVVQLVAQTDVSHCVERIFVSDKTSEGLAVRLSEMGSSVQVHGVVDLESLVEQVWPFAIQQPDCGRRTGEK